MSAQPGASGHVLVVDDDATNLELVERRLEVDGFSSTLVETGTDGLQMALSETFDAVLLDLRLPDLNGLLVIDLVREHRRLLRETTVLAGIFRTPPDKFACLVRQRHDAARTAEKSSV